MVGGGLLRLVTAGSVDDGKSTLIGRLLHDTRTILADQLGALARASRARGTATLDLALLTDGLEAERAQGITIDVAYRYFSTAARKFVVADAPGHTEYLRNMVTAASTADVAVLLVDVRQGIVDQTRRHACLARWLGIRHVVLAVNKMDLVGYAREGFDAVRAAFEDWAEPLGFASVTTVPVSALQSDMVVFRGSNLPWYTGPTLLQRLEAIEPLAPRTAAPFRFPVQWVASDEGWLCGTVASGTIGAGEAVVVWPEGRPARIEAMAIGDRSVALSGADQAVRLRLADGDAVVRGDLLSSPVNAPSVVRDLTADVLWLGTTGMDPAARYLLKHTTRTVQVVGFAGLRRIDTQTFRREAPPPQMVCNELAEARLRLAEPICADPYEDNRVTGSFILLDAHSGDTVAAGIVRATG